MPETGRWYNLATHFPWIGMRTAELGGAHVEYFRGIANPCRGEGRPGHDRRRHLLSLRGDPEPGQ